MMLQARCLLAQPMSPKARPLPGGTRPTGGAVCGRASRQPVVAVHAIKQHLDAVAAAKTAFSTCLAAAVLLTSSPAMAAIASAPPLKDVPTYGPSSVFNSTPYLVTISFLLTSEDSSDPSIKCAGDLGATDSGTMYTFPHPRGKCEVVDLHVEALSAAPGGGFNTIGTADWMTPGMVSTYYNTWAVTWVQDGSPTGHPGIVQVVDQQ